MVSGRISPTAICFAVLFRMGSSEIVSIFERFDTNGDEFLSFAEVRGGVVLDSQEDTSTLKRFFKAVDGDQDGLLNRRESRKLFKHMREFESETADRCRVHARGLRCLTWQMLQLKRLRYLGVLDTESVSF